MRELRTEIEIDAPPEQVWQVLTDFGAYPDWNPFIRSIEGEPQVGSRLNVRIDPTPWATPPQRRRRAAGGARDSTRPKPLHRLPIGAHGKEEHGSHRLRRPAASGLTPSLAKG
ncbi:MAG TPA: SRPBCC family protein [Actinomycetota bacterium]|nr:SRPBCC family protein [Actinomycetota bacterium]